MRMRLERDSMGPVRVPARALYGAQTARAAENFEVSGVRFPRVFIEALGRIKGACAEAAGAMKLLDRRRVRAIAAAATEVAEGRHDGEFILDVFQTGSGTSTNMNANEVIANLANRSLGGRLGSYAPVHPNDHVNFGQSSNDVIPTAAHVAALLGVTRDLEPALDQLGRSLAAKARQFDRIPKLGRTHLMDAVPIRLGQEFSGYAAQVANSKRRIGAAAAELLELPLGGTAVGTGLNAPPGLAKRAIRILALDTRLAFRGASNPFEAQAARDGMVFLSGALKSLAVALTKVANDIRWMGSGPHGGLGELRLPDLQPGSSIMPGKVNPVICEVVVQVAAQAIGNDAAVTAGGQGGAFELNAMIPVMTRNLLESISLLAATSRALATKCVDGLEADEERCRQLAMRSSALATALNPVVGYDRAAAIVKEAARRDVSIRDLAVEQGILTSEEADRVFDILKLTGSPSRGSRPARPNRPRRGRSRGRPPRS